MITRLLVALLPLALTGAASKPTLTCPTCYALSTPRSMHTATLLANGQVLVTGGQTDKGITASAEIFDPKSGQSRIINAMHVARAGHSATLLSDGRVFIAGGENGNHVVTASFEIFDPKTERFIDTGRLADASAGETTPEAGSPLRARGLEIVDGQGVVRFSVTIAGPSVEGGKQYPNRVLMRMGSPGAGPGVKLVSSAEGTTLGIMHDDRPLVQISANGTTSAVRLLAADGRAREITP